MDVSLSEQSLQVLFVEDHPIVRAGVEPIIRSLSDNVELFVAKDLKNATALRDNNPNLSLIVVDLMLPDGSGLDLLKSTIDAGLGVPVAIFSGSDDIDVIEDALSKGAKGFITKDTNPDFIIHALRLVIAGGIFIPAKLVGNFRRKTDLGNYGSSPEQKVRNLTHRQMEVFKLLVKGRTNREIAEQLVCAESTVKTHVTAVLKTLGFATRAKAIDAVADWPWLSNILDAD